MTFSNDDISSCFENGALGFHRNLRIVSTFHQLLLGIGGDKQLHRPQQSVCHCSGFRSVPCECLKGCDSCTAGTFQSCENEACSAIGSWQTS